jgi:aspartyl-tRNA synthetase
MIRSHGAGTLRASDAGSRVTLAGWVSSRRDHGGVASSTARFHWRVSGGHPR